jgi:hypothetical protein
MEWKKARLDLSGNQFTKEDGSTGYGRMQVYVETDPSTGMEVADDDGYYKLHAALPGEDSGRPSLMKEFAVLLGDKTRDLREEVEELQKQLGERDAKIERLQQRNDDLQGTMSDSFKKLVDKVTDGGA